MMLVHGAWEGRVELGFLQPKTFMVTWAGKESLGGHKLTVCHQVT